MSANTWAVAAFAVAVVLAAGLVLLVLDRIRMRRDLADLRARVSELADDARVAAPAEVPATEYLITTAGLPELDGSGGDRPAEPVSDRVVLSATFGEPLVKVAAFGYGVRHALRAENRNRIRFEIRREMRRARKQRRRDARQAVRDARRQEAA